MYRKCVTAFIFFVAFTHVLAVENDTVKPVYFSLIISGGENGFRSSGGVPSIDIALRKSSSFKFYQAITSPTRISGIQK